MLWEILDGSRKEVNEATESLRTMLIDFKK